MSSVIATLKEVKDHENRVGLTPSGVRELTKRGHTVLVQHRAGAGAGFSDEEYWDAGAELLESPGEILRKAEILVKVKEPLPSEYGLLEEFKGKTLFTYLHLSGVERELTHELLKHRITGIAYETVEDEEGRLPLLAPMSQVAGVLAIQYGAEYLQKKYGGVGVSLGEISGTERASVLVIGGGVVGWAAAKMAVKMGCSVSLLDISEKVLQRIRMEAFQVFTEEEQERFRVLLSSSELLSELLPSVDLLVGAVLVTGAKAPMVVSEAQVKSMKRGAVIVDVSIDQGGCIWGSRVTCHSHPTYELDGKIYCCVANIPGQVARQSTQALTAATFPYVLKLAEEGIVPALLSDSGFLKGVNTFGGFVTCKSVAEDLGMVDRFEDLETLIPRRGSAQKVLVT